MENKSMKRLNIITELLEGKSVPDAFSLAAELNILFQQLSFEEKKRKVTWDQLLELKGLWNKGYTLQQLANTYNCSIGTIQGLLKEFER